MGKLKDVATGRWSDYAILGLGEAEVVHWFDEGDYQGSAEYIVRLGGGWSFDPPEYILFGWSWGSCSGCDQFEDMGEHERIKWFVNNRESYPFAGLKVHLDLLLKANVDLVRKHMLGETIYRQDVIKKIEAIQAEVAHIEGMQP